jgi:hypothetical protein
VTGEYKFDNRESLYVVVDDFTPAPASTRVDDTSNTQGMISYVPNIQLIGFN